MTLFLSIIFGIIQGITEFLPISSSGHLGLFANLTGHDAEGVLQFIVLLHLGTLVAVVAVYWRDILGIVPAFFTMCGKFFRGERKWENYTLNERLSLLLLIGTLLLIPAAFLEGYIEAAMTSLIFVGAALMVNGLILFVSDRVSKGKLDLESLKIRHGFIVGLIQFVAIIPGISRSGSTITGGLFAGMTRETAVKFSFLLSIPAIAGACVFKLPEFFAESSDSGQMAIYLVGAAVAAIVGFFAIKLLVYIAKRTNFTMFAYYCWAVGAAAIVVGVVKLT